MHPNGRLATLLTAGAIALLASPPLSRTASGQDAACDDVLARNPPALNVLSVNILFSQGEGRRDASLRTIAGFAAGQEVDLILLQEVVGGLLVGTASSARDLQRLLAAEGLAFERRTAVEFAVPGLFAVANATLSRCDILFGLVEVLPAAPEFEVAGEVVELPRNVLMTRIDVPGFGGVDVYNTHLCAGCSADQRGEQLDDLLEFVADVEGFLPGEAPVVLGGDFNMDIVRDGAEEVGLYEGILDQGFTDAYAAAVGNDLPPLCDDPGDPDVHCTVGVTRVDVGDAGRRIDYVFTKNFGSVIEAEVVFNTLVDPEEDPEVPFFSDHAGVLVRAALPDDGAPLAAAGVGRR